MCLVNIDKILPNYIDIQGNCVPNYFTQFNVYNNFTINCRWIDCESIEVINSKLEILSSKIIDTVIGTSIEGQHLTGKKLILVGKIIAKINLKCFKCNNRICCIEKNIPFSTFIILPNPINEEDPINLRYLIEDATGVMISRNKLFINVTIIIQYLDEY
ncbi:SPOCS domain-containing protein [Clostridium frigidicarnis]|uniref:SipL SPOCS domain-containing protein n=1 Tax=Clostridium frigidicarnis TaxID=84698 RepID=A0A1I0X8S9_9CLOT|nr:SPOCS domain-containing protein [Clostridium frigidicarnis]SFA96836.1 protein of unknown function [Clostridium frigidicarnis]